jgi:subtilisin family serine protease
MTLSSAFAQVSAIPGPGDPKILELAGPGTRDASATAALAQKARESGPIRVIVELKVVLQPAHRLSAQALAAQRRTLESAQDRVIARALGGVTTTTTAVAKFDSIPFISIFVDADQLARLLADPDVVDLREDVPLRPTLLESIPLIKAKKVWDSGSPGTGYAIAVLDTGVDKTHPMLTGKVISEACYSTHMPSQRIRSLCPGQAPSSTVRGSGINCSRAEGCDHGTHVAGIAAGRPMRVTGHTGVAKDAGVIAIQVFSQLNRARDCFVGPPCLGAFYTDVIKGLERVYESRSSHPIAAVNLSLGGGFLYNEHCDLVQPAMTAIIKQLRAAGIASVIASGNGGADNGITPPACISAAIAVGSTLDTSDAISNFSNHAAQVRLMAPGSGITSSVPGGGTATKNGTSMATPHVAGAFALLRDVHHDATVDDIAAALECTGKPVDRMDIIRPRIDLGVARNFLLNPPNTPRTFNFDTAEEVAPWKTFMGRFSVASGLYRANGTPGWKIKTLPNCNEAMTIEARMRRVDTDPDTPWNSGIFFKAQLNSTAKRFSGYFAGFNKLNGGQVFLNRLHNFDLNTLYGGWAFSLCAQQMPINLSGFNTLKVVTSGGVHRVSLNGVEACNVTDQTYGIGGNVAFAGFLPDPVAGGTFELDWIKVIPNEIGPPRP